MVNGVLGIQGNIPFYLAFPPHVRVCGGVTDFPLQKLPKSLMALTVGLLKVRLTFVGCENHDQKE